MEKKIFYLGAPATGKSRSANLLTDDYSHEWLLGTKIFSKKGVKLAVMLRKDVDVVVIDDVPAKAINDAMRLLMDPCFSVKTGSDHVQIHPDIIVTSNASFDQLDITPLLAKRYVFYSCLENTADGVIMKLHHPKCIDPIAEFI